MHGRKIDLEIIDDQSSAENLTAAQDLVQNREVFAVINNSAFAFLSYRFLLENDVPMIGGGFDGNYYGEKGNENILSALGNVAPVNGLTPDWPAKIAKRFGATKMASIAYSVSPSGTASAEAVQKYAAPAFGLEDAYINTTLEFGTKDVGPIVLGIKNSGADALYLPLDNDTNFAIVQGLVQNGVQMKANMLATGYSQDLLDQPVVDLMTPNDVMFSTTSRSSSRRTRQSRSSTPTSRSTPASPVCPTTAPTPATSLCDMAITGLEEAGANPTRQGFVDGIRNLGEYDAAGLTCLPLQVGYDNFGKTPETSCNWFVIVKDGKFKVLNGGKPIKSKLLGDPKLIEANRSRDRDDDHGTRTIGLTRADRAFPRRAGLWSARGRARDGSSSVTRVSVEESHRLTYTGLSNVLRLRVVGDRPHAWDLDGLQRVPGLLEGGVGELLAGTVDDRGEQRQVPARVD